MDKELFFYIFTEYIKEPLPIAIISLLTGHILTRAGNSAVRNSELKSTKICLARAFWAEIKTLFELHDKIKLQPWLNVDDQIDVNMINIQSDYLSIFNANADKIGMFDSKDAIEFLKFYTYAKAYIDTLRELSRRWKAHAEREEKYLSDPTDANLSKIYNLSRKDIFKLYKLCHEQQTELYRCRDEVKKTFDKYI